jgi:hypothetical protein
MISSSIAIFFMISPPFRWIDEEKKREDIFIEEQDGCQKEGKNIFFEDRC